MKTAAFRLFYAACTAALFVFFWVATERRAYAYVDPGSGLLVFQSLSAVVTGALFYFRCRLKSIFTKKKTLKSEADG
jgi:hypothetical protein